jgi:hypothetical protein
VQLDPAFVFEGRALLPEPDDHTLEGLSEDGTLLFADAFEPAVLDHAPDVRHFGVSVPATPGLEAALHMLRVRGPAGEARLARPAVAAAPPDPSAQRSPQAVRLDGGLARVTCPDAEARAILVQDAGTKPVLGTANAPSLVVASAPGTRLAVSCSDGVRSARFQSVVE